jgi:chromosomal replication initiator protein
MPPPPAFWDGVLRRLGSDIPAFTLDAWVRPLGVEEHEDGLRLLCPTAFHRERIRQRLLPRIAHHVAEETGRPARIELILGGDGQPPRPAEAPEASPPQTAAGDGGAHPTAPAGLRRAPQARASRNSAARRRDEADTSRASLDYTFDSFVVGPCNALAREATFAVAHARQSGLNPLYLASGPGLGKTHLARAMVATARSEGAHESIYESAEGFTNRFMQSIRGKKMDAFKQRYGQRCDLLVLEDVQFLRSKHATQLELFHTLTHLVDAGVRVVLTGDRLPRDIADLDLRLRSQITAGLVAEIEAPDAAVRRKILRAKAARGGVRIPDECLDLLVENVRGSVRDLEGALIQLVATASLLKQPIDTALTRTALHKLTPLPERCRLSPQAVLEVVACFFGVTRDAMASKSRRRDVLVPRQLAMYFCRRYTDESLATIGQLFNRDHPAVSNAVKTVERRILERAPLRYQVEELADRIERLPRR